MTETGMGRAVGENAEMVTQIAKWVTDVASMPVYIKITPNHAYAD